VYWERILVGRKPDRYRIPPNHTNIPASKPNIIKGNKMLANPTDKGGIIAVSVEDAISLAAASPVVNVLAGDNTEMGVSTFSGRPDVFVSATTPVVVSCQ
jgi:hypothetical protein